MTEITTDQIVLCQMLKLLEMASADTSDAIQSKLQAAYMDLHKFAKSIGVDPDAPLPGLDDIADVGGEDFVFGDEKSKPDEIKEVAPGEVVSDPWDAPHNRYYEPVEKVAQELYEALPYDGEGEKPAWVPHGNSNKQDEARALARAQLKEEALARPVTGGPSFGGM